VWIITLRSIKQFAEQHPQQANSLYAWSTVVEQALWQCPNDIRKTWGSVDIIHTAKSVLPKGDCRAIFDIGGNHLRLVAHVNFLYQSVYVKDCLTHGEYDKINWETYKYEIKEKSHEK
jgi:mRNA interferase HigB